MASEALVDVVADELDRMARRDGDSSLELPELRKIWARSHSGEWDEAAAERVLRDGIEALDGRFGKLSKAEAALILFNLDAHAEAGAGHPAVLSRLERLAGIAGDVAIRARTAELRRSLAAVLVGRDVRIKVEPRDNVASLLANLDAVEAPEAGRRREVKPATAAAALVTAVVVVVGATLVVAKLVAGNGEPGAGDDLKTASASSAPLKIQNVTVFQNRVRDLHYVLSEPVAEPPPSVPAGNDAAESFGSWYQKHGGTALESGYTNITVQGNDSKPVRITDMKIAAKCAEPLNGSYLEGYTQGGERETIKIGFNLDVPNPMPEQMTAISDLQGMGLNYFSAHTVELGPGETEVLTVGVYTKKQYCKFTLQLVVATANGTVLQDVDATDKRFEVTGRALAKSAETPNSGYQKMYRQDASLSWNAVDPNSPEGP